MLTAATYLGALALLLPVASGLRRQEPFSRANARRLTALGLLIAIAGTVVPVVSQLATSSALAESQAGSLLETTTFTISFLWMAVGLSLAAAGEAFRRGVVLHDDVEGLV